MIEPNNLKVDITGQLEYIVLMKVGPFCGLSLEQIITIKKEEQIKVGHFYFGYGGSFCHPGRILRFMKRVNAAGYATIKLLFLETPSDFDSPLPRASLVSQDGIDWRSLPADVLLVGSKFAFVAKDIQKVDYALDISQYRSMLGLRRGRRLNEYMKFRVDKSCAVYEKDVGREPAIVNVKYESDLVSPYCVLVK